MQEQGKMLGTKEVIHLEPNLSLVWTCLELVWDSPLSLPFTHVVIHFRGETWWFVIFLPMWGISWKSRKSRFSAMKLYCTEQWSPSFYAFGILFDLVQFSFILHNLHTRTRTITKQQYACHYHPASMTASSTSENLCIKRSTSLRRCKVIILNDLSQTLSGFC